MTTTHTDKQSVITEEVESRRPLTPVPDPMASSVRVTSQVAAVTLQRETEEKKKSVQANENRGAGFSAAAAAVIANTTTAHY